MPATPNKPALPPSPALEVPADLEAVYVNLVRIAHTQSDFLLDFAHMMPLPSPARVRSRIVMTPLGVKLLHRALTENISRYEAAFGEIKMPGESATLADMLFRPPPPPEPPKE